MRALFIASLFILCLTYPLLAIAQARMGIVATVNDTIITSDDLDQRLRLAMAFSGVDNTPEVRAKMAPQILQRLIDAALQQEELERQRITVSPVEINQARNRLREQFSLSREQLDQLLDERGIRDETLEKQLQAEVGWTKFLFQRLRPRLVVSDQDVDETIEAISGRQGIAEWYVLDIFLPVDSPAGDEDARELAEGLREEIDEGAPFENLATQFPLSQIAETDSISPRWVTADDVDPALADALRPLRRGDVTAPVRTAAGYHIAKLIDKRRLMTADADQSEVSLRQMILPVPEDATQDEMDAMFARMEVLVPTIAGCNDFEQRAQTISDARYQDLGRMQIKQLHEEIRPVVRELPVGTVTNPFQTPAGIHLMIICERINARATIIDRERIREKLTEKKLMLEAFRVMQDIRRAAFIDIRL